VVLRRRLRPSASAAALAVALATFVAGPAFADEADEAEEPTHFALTGCRVIPVEGDPIPDGVVVVKDGRIEAVGPAADVKVPKGAEVVKTGGGVLMPAFVHPASRLLLRGTGGGNDNSVEPDRDVQAELNPWLPANLWTAANGFGTLGLVPGRGIVGGRGVAVRPAADSVEAMLRRELAVVRSDASTGKRFRDGLRAALSAARKELDADAKYARDKAAWAKAKKKAEADKKPVPKEPKEPKGKDSNEPYRKVLEGDAALLVYVDSSAEVHALVEALSDERVRGEKLRLYVQPSGESYRSAGLLADLGATCLIRAGIATLTGSTDRFCPAVYYRDSGCPVILMPPSDDRTGLRGLRQMLAVTVRAGFPRAAALRAATAGPAAMLGLGDDAGALKKGARADMLLLSGDPLLPTSVLRRVWIDGQEVEETP